MQVYTLQSLFLFFIIYGIKMISDVIKLIRVKQWIKNIFVIVPLFFSLKFTELSVCIQALYAFLAFCFTSSFVYVLNDIMDREKDKLHPKKKFRPLASGALSVSSALVLLAVLLGIIAVLLLKINDSKVFIIICTYLIMNFLYSFKLKHLVLADVFVIALGFILRVYAGAYAIDVSVSSFLFMTTFFLALFLAFSKRKSELSKTGETTRSVLKKYSAEIINQYMIISAGLTILCYSLYTLEPNTIEHFGTNRLIYSVFFVTYGIFRYMYLLNFLGEIEDPTEAVYADKGLFLTCAGFCGYILLILFNIV